MNTELPQLLIYTPAQQMPFLSKLIKEQNGLEDWVAFLPIEEAKEPEKSLSLLVYADKIVFPIDRSDITPPYLLPDLPFSEEHFMASVLLRLVHVEQAMEFVGNDSALSLHFLAFMHFITGEEFPEYLLNFLSKPDSYKGKEAFKAAHNRAVCVHYNPMEEEYPVEEISRLYEQALTLAEDENDRTFTLKHYAVFLMDIGQEQKAEALLREVKESALTSIARHDIQHALAHVLLYRLSSDYDSFTMGELRSLLKEVLDYKRSLGNKVKEAICLLDVSQAALLAKSYSESLGFVNKAIQIFQEEDFEEFYGEALRRKGVLLYAWAQAGNPQFFKSAMESFQKALEQFPKETAPSVYADIHHHLARIYAELPVEDSKKSLMAGLSVSSFRKALEFFTKEEYPYEYATICTHFGNALCHFPPSLHSDHFEKALHYYREALDIRTERFPTERALTLLNYLEAAWNLREKENGSYQKQFQDMWDKANEILHLTKDETILQEARKHIEALERLRSGAGKK